MLFLREGKGLVPLPLKGLLMQELQTALFQGLHTGFFSDYKSDFATALSTSCNFSAQSDNCRKI